VTPPRETLSRIDDAIARFDKALEAVRKIPRQGQEAVAVNGIEHELVALAKRLQALRDEVAGDGADRGG
jgi:hypothetical protein